jgi:dephospho-CoA kinase
MKRLESIVHPMLRAHEKEFLTGAEQAGALVAVLDIPLLFETGAENRVDAVLVVSAPEEVQHARILARPNMTAAKLETILARQMHDADKRARADFVVDTSNGLESAREQIRHVLAKVATMPRRRS